MEYDKRTLDHDTLEYAPEYIINSKHQTQEKPHLTNCFSASMPLPSAENGLKQLSIALLFLSRAPLACPELEPRPEPEPEPGAGLTRLANSVRSRRVISDSTLDALEDILFRRDDASASPSPAESSSAAACFHISTCLVCFSITG